MAAARNCRRCKTINAVPVPPPSCRILTVNKKRLIDLAGFLLIALILLVGYKLSPLLLPKADITLLPDPSCDIQRGPCALDLPDGGRLVLSLGDGPVPVLKPVPIDVQVNGLQPSKVEVDFAGVDMNMGLNRTELSASKPGNFTGSATLPVCVTGRMDWRATVMVETGRQRIAIPFVFESVSAPGEHDPAPENKP